MKTFITTFTLVLILIALAFFGGAEDYCIGHGVRIRYISPTIQTVSFYADQENKHLGFTTLLKGNITGHAIVNGYLVGYLSLKSKEDDLDGLLGINDKEGYFIVDMKSRAVVKSGLEFVDVPVYLKLVADVKSIDFADKPDLFARCWF